MEIKSTRAAVLVESKKPLEIVDLMLPDRLKPGQILVELISSGICGAQINEIDAIKGPDKFLPHLLGHEGYARVIEVGPAVRKVVANDFVVLHWRPSSGIQSETPVYRLGNTKVNAGWVTTFNEHAVVSENRVTKVYGELNVNVAPLLGCALTTALGVLENDAAFSFRDSLLITGFGGVGNCILQFAKFLNARQIIVVDRDENKRIEALRLGADNFIAASSKEMALKELENLFGKEERPSVAIETTGVPSLIELCYEFSASTARVVLVGVPNVEFRTSIYTLPLHFGKSITGSKGGDSNPEKDIPFILDLFRKRNILEDNFVAQNSNLAEINFSIEKMRNGEMGRQIICFK